MLLSSLQHCSPFTTIYYDLPIFYNNLPCSTFYINLPCFVHLLQQSTMPCPPFTSIYHALSTFYNKSTMLCPPFTTIYHALPTSYNNLPRFAHLLQQSTMLCPPFTAIYHALPTFCNNLSCFVSKQTACTFWLQNGMLFIPISTNALFTFCNILQDYFTFFSTTIYHDLFFFCNNLLCFAHR